MIPYLVAYTVLSTAGLLLLRARLEGGGSLGSLVSDPLLLLGAICYALSFLTWLATLRNYEITRALPVFLGVGYGTVMIGAVVVLGEHVTGARLAGIVLVGLGILLIGR